MECQVCKTRSSVGYCDETRVLVCELCSTTCHHCGSLIQTAVAHESPSSGHPYCTKCWEERQARREARKKKRETPPPSEGGGTSLEDLMGGAPVDMDVAAAPSRGSTNGDGEGEEEEILVASGWQPPPPWKLSFQAGLLALGAIIFVLIFPSFYRVVLPGGISILTPLILLAPAIIAILWGILGLTSRDYRADTVRSILGIGAAGMAIVLCLHALSSDPADEALDQMEFSRDTMTPQELEDWRNSVLDRHRR